MSKSVKIKVTVTFQVQILWKYCQDAESGRLVGICDALKITAEAKTYPDLLEYIGEVMNEFFNDLLKEGKLEGYLRAHGGQLSNQPPKPKAGTSYFFDVPINTQKVEARDLSAAIH